MNKRHISMCLLMGVVALSTGCSDQSGPTSPTVSGAALGGTGSGSGGSGSSGTGTGSGGTSVAANSGGTGVTTGNANSGVSVLPTVNAAIAGPVNTVLHVAGDTLVPANGPVAGLVNNTMSPLLRGVLGTPAGNANPGLAVGVAGNIVTPLALGTTVNTGTILGGLAAPVLAPVTGSSGGAGGTPGLLSPVLGAVAPVTGGVAGNGGLLGGVLGNGGLLGGAVR